MNLIWVIFSGSEYAPFVVKIIKEKEALKDLVLEDDQWLEEFEI